MKLLWQHIIDEASTEEFIHLARQENNEHLVTFITNICNAQRPIEGTVTIIKELCANGYTHHIGSNIGQTVFEQLSNPDAHPQFAELFACFELDKSHVVTHNNGTIIRKPDIRYYQGYLKKNNIDLNKTRVIFIDDRRENIKAARKAGLHAIHFKNPAQLRKDLRALGLDLNPPIEEAKTISFEELLVHECRRI